MICPVTDELAWRQDVNDVMRHDMRTRVGIGKGYISMLVAHYDKMTAEQRAAALSGIADAFDRLDEFSRRVLMDEKLETRSRDPQRGDIPLSGLVAASVAAYPEVVVELAPGLPETAYLDPVMTREILDNLLANARTAAPHGATVTLRVTPGEGTTVRFAVTDAGDGVTEADLAVIFERYGRTERSRLKHAAGMGLGLSIVRRMTEAHGGTYGVDSGEETTFWVELPVSPDSVPSPEGHVQDPYP